MARRRPRLPLWARALFLVVALAVTYFSTDPDPAGTPPPELPRHPPVGTGGVEPDPLPYGVPTDADPTGDLIIRRSDYVVSYDAGRGRPNWVGWRVAERHFGDAPRCDCFSADTALPSSVTRVTSSDYTGSGYDRGHLVRSEERTHTETANARTFLMTNVLPQTHDLNAGPWHALERHVEEHVTGGAVEALVLGGGRGSLGTLGGRGKVVIPSHTWKIVLFLPVGLPAQDAIRSGRVRGLAVDMPNRRGIRGHDWRRYAVSIDSVETLTGYDFFADLPDDLESALEAHAHAD